LAPNPVQSSHSESTPIVPAAEYKQCAEQY
jgi:hypothetical protein